MEKHITLILKELCKLVGNGIMERIISTKKMALKRQGGTKNLVSGII